MVKKTPKNDPKGSEGKSKIDLEDGKKGKKKGKSAISFKKLRKENKNLRGTVSALTKKVDDMSDSNVKLQDGLKSALGIEEEIEPEDAGQAALKKVDELQSDLTKERMKNSVSAQVDALVDEKGNAIPDSAKKYLKDKIQVSEADPATVEALVKSEWQSLSTAIAVTASGKDSRPESGSPTTDSSKPGNANQVLEQMKADGKIK